MVALAVDSDAAVILLGCWLSWSCFSCLDNLALLCVANFILRDLLLDFTKTIMIDVKSITDIVRPITNILADASAVAPVHLELIIVAAAKNGFSWWVLHAVKLIYLWIHLVLRYSHFLQCFHKQFLRQLHMWYRQSVGMSVQVTLVQLVVSLVGQ